jgi:hypothetical protein
MKTIFMAEPFGKLALGWSPAYSQGRTQETAFGVFEDILQTFGIEEEDLIRLIDQLPKAAGEKYKAKYEECKKMGLTTASGAKCLYDLFQEVRRALKEEEEKKLTPARPLPQAPQEAIPWWPFAIGGVAAAGLIVYLATRG